MKKLAFTTAIALALSTAAFAAEHGGHGSMGGGSMGGASMGGGSVGGASGAGFSGGAPGGFSKGPGGPTGFSGTAGPSRGQMGGVYNQGNIHSYGQGGPYKQGGTYQQGYTQHGNHHLYNYGGQKGQYGEHNHNGVDLQHHGVVSGNFFEHGRHFRFRRFFRGQWVFLNTWDDCTAYAWVNVAPGTWAWVPIDVCIG